ncbi:hypothetical protein BC828DRAFT_388903 [Blastocladiella britannica]|nr:hypothetical protein BC828DRAFT_388903 [Blastocladiella britannica]
MESTNAPRLRLKRRRGDAPLEELLLEFSTSTTGDDAAEPAKRARRGPAPRLFRRVVHASSANNVSANPAPPPGGGVVLRVTRAAAQLDSSGQYSVVEVTAERAGARAVAQVPEIPAVVPAVTNKSDLTDLEGFAFMLQQYLHLEDVDDATASGLQANIDQMTTTAGTRSDAHVVVGEVMELSDGEDDDDNSQGHGGMLFDEYLPVFEAGPETPAPLTAARLLYDSSAAADLEQLLLFDEDSSSEEGDYDDPDSNDEGYFANDYPDEDDDMLLHHDSDLDDSSNSGSDSESGSDWEGPQKRFAGY